MLEAWPWRTSSKLSIEKEGLLVAGERKDLTLGEVEGTVVERMKERMGIVAVEGSVELQYRRSRTSKLIFCAVR
jgi:hypothetical protein